jgi:hypothetical protein
MPVRPGNTGSSLAAVGLHVQRPGFRGRKIRDNAQRQVDPSIFGTRLEQALNEKEQRH